MIRRWKPQSMTASLYRDPENPKTWILSDGRRAARVEVDDLLYAPHEAETRSLIPMPRIGFGLQSHIESFGPQLLGLLKSGQRLTKNFLHFTLIDSGDRGLGVRDVFRLGRIARQRARSTVNNHNQETLSYEPVP